MSGRLVIVLPPPPEAPARLRLVEFAAAAPPAPKSAAETVRPGRPR